MFPSPLIEDLDLRAPGAALRPGAGSGVWMQPEGPWPRRGARRGWVLAAGPAGVPLKTRLGSGAATCEHSPGAR